MLNEDKSLKSVNSKKISSLSRIYSFVREPSKIDQLKLSVHDSRVVANSTGLEIHKDLTTSNIGDRNDTKPIERTKTASITKSDIRLKPHGIHSSKDLSPNEIKSSNDLSPNEIKSSKNLSPARLVELTKKATTSNLMPLYAKRGESAKRKPSGNLQQLDHKNKTSLNLDI